MKIWVSPANGISSPSAHRRFQRAHHRRADRNNPATRGPDSRNLRAQAGADVEPLAMHAVVGQRLAAHRLESACANMQGDVAEFDAALGQRLQQCAGRNAGPAVGAATAPDCWANTVW